MTNEETALAIQQGSTELVPQLWANTERFIALKAREAMLHIPDGTGGVTAEDLYQQGFFALLRAADTYDADSGSSFLTWLAYHLKTAFAEAAGYRSAKRDPLDCAPRSLDAPASCDDDDTDPLRDRIASPAPSVEDDATERIYTEELHGALDGAIARLPARQGAFIRALYWDATPQKEVAARHGVSSERVRQQVKTGLRALRKGDAGAELRRFLDDGTDAFAHVGVRAFNATGTSAVEMLVLQREELQSRFYASRISQTRAEIMAILHTNGYDM